MKIALSFAELHTPLFLGGRNFGLKLSKDKFSSLELSYDQTKKELWVTNEGKTAIIPTSNVVSMTPADEAAGKEDKGGPIPLKEALPPPNMQQGPAHAKRSSAQVSGPTAHVFHPGPGKTRD